MRVMHPDNLPKLSLFGPDRRSLFKSEQVLIFWIILKCTFCIGASLDSALHLPSRHRACSDTQRRGCRH